MSSRSSSPHPTTIVPPYHHHHHFATWESNKARNNAGSSGGFKALPSSRGKRRQKKEEREVLRIMDESYLPRRHRGGDGGHDLETRGELHDIDHRPFPPINNMMRSPQRAATMGYDNISCLDVQHALRKPRTAPAAYWETFNLPPPPFHSHCMLQEPEEVGLGVGGAKVGYEREHRHPLSTRRSTTPAYYYLDNTQGAINNGAGGKGAGEGPPIESQGGGCVLKKKRRGNNEGEDRDEGKRGGVNHEGDNDNKAARERYEGTTMIVRPKDKLHQTWVATRLGVHLKVIRTQRWLKEHM